MRSPSDPSLQIKQLVGQIRPQFYLSNSHDGTGKYEMRAGAERKICMNGLYVPEGLVQAVSIRHLGNRTIEEIVEVAQSYRQNVDLIGANIRRFQEVTLSSSAAVAFVQQAISLRHDSKDVTVNPGAFLAVKRAEDVGFDLWRTFNRAQEWLLRGGYDVTKVTPVDNEEPPVGPQGAPNPGHPGVGQDQHQALGIGRAVLQELSMLMAAAGALSCGTLFQMNTALIKIGELYAISTAEHGIVRFLVTSIRTVSLRTSATKKADTSNYITGVIAEGDMPGTETERTREVGPDVIIDHYTKYEALQAKQAEETRIIQEEQDRKMALRERLRAKLYEFTNLRRPERPQSQWASYHEPFETNYGNAITITEQAMPILLEVLEALAVEEPL